MVEAVAPNGAGRSSGYDPSLLTTEQIRHEIDALKELLGARLDGIDEATRLRIEQIEHIPANTESQVNHLKELIDEKFASVQQQFEERDVRVLQSAAAATTAVNAALQAAKEAVGEQNKSFTLSIDKSEASTTKQLEAQAQTLRTVETGLNGKIEDLKSTQSRLENIGLGRLNATQENRQQSNWTITALVGAAGLALSIAIALSQRGGG